MTFDEAEFSATGDAVDEHRVAWFSADRPVAGGTVYARVAEEDGPEPAAGS